MIRFFAAHPTGANLLMLILLVLGISAAPDLRRETFPRTEPRRVEIKVVYPGATSTTVLTSICQRLDDAVEAVSNVEEMKCDAREGVAIGIATMLEGEDFDRFYSDLRIEIDAINNFPDKAENPVIKQLGRTDAVASVAVTGPEDLVELKAYAEQVKDRMIRWGGISQVKIAGFSDHQIRIELNDVVLRQFGLSAADIADIIKRQSVDIPGGKISTREQEITLRFAGEAKRSFEFADIVIVSGSTGGQVRLGDIATITDRFEKAEQGITFNGKPAALLNVTKRENEDTLKAIDAITAFVAHENAVAPPSVDLVVTNDASSIVRDRLSLLFNNGSQGLLLVFLAMWLFFGLRFSFWVAMGLPVSFLGAIFLMMITGYSINMLTMVGLLIAIGILMDDAIVISENVASFRQQGHSALEAAIQGAQQVLPSILASFITTACIFGSLAFLKGDIGAVLKVVPAVMLFVLSVSLIEAFLILPNHLYHSMHGAPEKRDNALVVWVENSMDKMRNGVGQIAAICIEFRYFTIGAAVGLLLISVSMLSGGFLKFVAFPEMDGDVIEARLLLPAGQPIERTTTIVNKLVAGIEQIDAEFTPEQPGGQSLVRAITVKWGEVSDSPGVGGNKATVIVDLLSAEIRTVTADQILGQWRNNLGQVADIQSLKFGETVLGPGGLPIEMRLQGSDLEQLKRASLDLQDRIRRYNGVYDLADDLFPGKPELQISLRDGASNLGLDSNMIASQLSGAFLGNTATEFQRGSESYEVDIRLDRRDRDSLADLDYFTITTPEGGQVPLNMVADVVAERSWDRIIRIDGQETVTISANLDTSIANASEILADLKPWLNGDFNQQYPDIAISLEGQNKSAGDAQSSMVSGFVLGLFGVFVLLSFQFRSYLEPIVVMVAIPLAFTGAVAGHMIMGLDFSMPSLLGFLSLGGIVVNNSILLVEFTKLRMRNGQPLIDAAIDASRGRFRAIFLTTVTTVVGLLPMLSETSMQAQILIPMVTSIAFGLIASTLLVLMVIPALYTIMGDLGVVKETAKADE